MVQDRDALGGRRLRYGLEISIDVRQFLIGYDLLSVRRHFTCRLADVFREGSKWDRVRGQARAYSTVAVVVVALVTAIAVENLLAVLRGRRLRRENTREGQQNK